MSILILSPHLHVWFQITFFPSGLLTKLLYEFLISPMRATRHNFIYPPVSLSLLGSNFLLGSVYK